MLKCNLFLLINSVLLLFSTSISIKCTVSDDENSSNESDDDAVLPEYFVGDLKDIWKAWSDAPRITGRNSNFCRLDKFNNVILSRKYTKASPLSFQGLVIFEDDTNEKVVRFDAVQSDFHGSSNPDNFENSMKFVEKSEAQEALLDLLEVGLRGRIDDEKGLGYSQCWTPSQIHQDLFEKEPFALRWVNKLFTKESKFGMFGHNTIFKPMGVSLKDMRRYDDVQLHYMNSATDFLFINNYIPQCSDYMKTVDLRSFLDMENRIKYAENVKNNWGFPKVERFSSYSTSTTSSKGPRVADPVLVAAKVAKSKIHDDEFPPLSAASKPKTIVVTKKKKNSAKPSDIIDI